MNKPREGGVHRILIFISEFSSSNGSAKSREALIESSTFGFHFHSTVAINGAFTASF